MKTNSLPGGSIESPPRLRSFISRWQQHKVAHGTITAVCTALIRSHIGTADIYSRAACTDIRSCQLRRSK